MNNGGVEKMRKNKSEARNGYNFKEQWPFAVLLAPFVILFFLFILLPVFSSVALSFFDFDMVSLPKFTGFSNYTRMLLDDEIFITTLKNTLLLAVLTGPAGFLLSFVLAWFINEFSPAVRTVLSFMFYCPALVGNAYYIWQVFFSNDRYGYANSILLSANLITEPISWMKEPQYIIPIIVIVQLWMSMGVSFLANISGLQNINDEMYEAGAIDGIRSRWQELWYITLPSMKHMLLFSAVCQIASAFSIGGICVALVGYPSVNYTADTIVSYLSDVGTVKYEMGYACAISVFLFALMLLTRAVIGKLLERVGK